MKVRIGIIGPADSVEKIMYIVKEFPDAVFDAYTYENAEEIDKIMAENGHTYDQWFFSGEVNYSYAIEKKLIEEDRASFPQLYGFSFFGTLLEAQFEGDRVYNSFSIDTVKKEKMDKILSFFQFDRLNYYNSPLTGYQYISDLVDFHKKHYENGQTDIALTPLRKVYTKLKELEIPVYRVKPSYLAIKLSLQILIERAQTNRYKKAQMAVIGFQAGFNSNAEDDLHYSFKLKHRELELRRVLLHLTEKVNGSLMQIGDGLFFIFTTRGEMKLQTENDLSSLIVDMKAQANIHLLISIGYGETVSQAEQHVRFGFRNHKHEEQSIIVVEDDYSISVKDASNQTLSYQTIQLGEEWKGKIKNISPGVVSKIAAYANQSGKPEFTTNDVARWIHSTERNGRRIIREMEKYGIVEQCGEVQSGARGRPRRVFRFKKP
ncbi:hypothetical protein NSQ77_14615 [Oceanobacillus sp. FSL K6-2867]|uniref:hypothetical protein n=1 Tax=Oceanobacillus sp. FSL K6-2867 TaxID=2954748 RepID=UPI0030D6E925